MRRRRGGRGRRKGGMKKRSSAFKRRMRERIGIRM